MKVRLNVAKFCVEQGIDYLISQRKLQVALHQPFLTICKKPVIFKLYFFEGKALWQKMRKL